jgi:hypothetical protein
MITPGYEPRGSVGRPLAKSETHGAQSERGADETALPVIDPVRIGFPGLEQCGAAAVPQIGAPSAKSFPPSAVYSSTGTANPFIGLSGLFG